MAHVTRLAGPVTRSVAPSSPLSSSTARLARLLAADLCVSPHGAHRCGQVLTRRFLGDGQSWSASAAAVAVARRCVHERPFQELPEDVTQGEAYVVARDALLQLNIMLRRGIEPDVLMYTSLIATMGRAGLEWQAYKLFSRMIEQNIQPLPETYVALRDATSKQRAALREQIQTKVEESVDVFPEELAEAERARQREEDRSCIAKFEEYMRGVLPATSSAPSPSPTARSASSAAESGDSDSGNEKSSPRASGPASIATMHIRNPKDAWNTTQMAQEQRGHAHALAKGDGAAELRTALGRLDEEELRIYLSAQRQLRHGSKAQLIDRILRSVSATAIHAMLARRSHYFRSVEQILAADLRQLNMSSPAAAPGAASGGGRESADSHAGPDQTMRATEREAMAPEVLHAPWGILRKPMRSRADAAATAAVAGATSRRSAERLERVRLSEPELSLIKHKADTNDLDELPESLLRRYAYQFQLRWRRKDGAASLLQAVQWHVTTYVARPADASEAAAQLTSPPPTPPIRLQKEREGMQETLANYEAFRVIAQRTNNLQVVDGHEINRHLQRVRRDAAQRERRLETALRRERHVMAAAGLAASAKSFTPPPHEDTAVTQVLGIGEGDGGGDGDGTGPARLATPHEGATALIEAGGDAVREREGAGTEAGGEASASELPPWALFEEEDEFNLSSGRFGDPTLGRYQELSDSKMQVLPTRAAQSQWSVDRQLLPSSLKNIVQEAELEQQRRHDAVEHEYARRLQYTKYRKWDNMIARAQARKRGHAAASEEEEAEEDGAEAVQPLPAKRRLAQLLRKGKDRQRLSTAVRAKYSRSL